MAFQTPILFLLYNRPETSRIVFDAIREVRPAKLFVAADGPSMSRPGDHEKTEEARSLIDSVDWECDVRTLFRDENLGCKKAVSSAVSWLFDQVEEGIILEDDCLPSQSFFRYCEDLLAYYKDDENVLVISGDNFQDGRDVTKDSYYFSRYPHCWGWATWRRAWCKYDTDMDGLSAFESSQAFLDTGAGDPVFRDYWLRNFNRVLTGEVDSWATVWTFSCWANGGLTALPVRNLVKNIGFGVEATHTKGSSSAIDVMQAEELDFPLRHPSQVKRHIDADAYTDSNHYNMMTPLSRSIVRRIIGRIKSCF